MIAIQIKDPTISVREVTSSRNGRTYRFAEQHGMVKIGDELRRVRFRVEEGKPYSPGVYTLAPESYSVDQFGGLSLSPVLVPAK